MLTRIAILPLGYADRVDRRFTNNGEVLIQGRRHATAGRVAMNYIMVDVGDDPVKHDTKVMVWGESPQDSIQALEVAQKIRTTTYELTCAVSKRVKRVYLGDP